jgi:hypothetical protein
VDDTFWKWAAGTVQVVGGAVGGWWLKELSERLKVRRETLPYIPKQTVRIVEWPGGQFLCASVVRSVFTMRPPRRRAPR